MKTIKLSILAALFLCGLFLNAQIPTNGLVAYYPFNGNANDESGTGNNGTVNGAVLTTGHFGNANSAYSFNGTSNNITVNDSPLFNVESWTVSAWYKTTNNSSVPQRITHKQQGATGSNYLSIIMRYGKIYGSATNGSGEIKAQDAAVTSDGNWHNVVYTRNDIANYYKLYVDGILKDSVADTYGNLANTSSFIIGSTGITSNYWNGCLDDIGVWDRELVPTEINQIFNNGICYQTITVTDTLIINANLTGFSPVTFQNSIKIYPNPTSDHITIDFGSNYSTMNGYTLKITNSLSQIVYTTPINQQQTIVDLSTWTGNGIYFVHLIDAQSNTIDIRKIVLQ